LENSRIVQEFLELIRLDVAPRKERVIADVMTKKLRELGCTVWEDDAAAKVEGDTGNLYAVLEGQLEGSVLFSAHLDRLVTEKPIEPRIEGEKIVSSGTILAADDVAGLVGILEGLRRIVESGRPHPRIEVLLTVCEELTILGSRYCDYGRLQSKIAYVLDSPGRLGRVIHKAPSLARLEFTVHGKAAHAGNCPEQGISAPLAAAKVLTRIPSGRLDFESTANFSTFQAACPHTAVNDYAFVQGETRSGSHQKVEDYIARWEQVCREVEAETGAKINTQVHHLFRCFDVPRDSLPICVVARAFERMGVPLVIEGGGGGMDANRFNENGIQSVGLATGYFDNHSSFESIYLADLERTGEMVENIVLSYCETTANQTI